MSIILNALKSEEKKEEDVLKNDEFFVVQHDGQKKSSHSINIRTWALPSLVVISLCVSAFLWFKPGSTEQVSNLAPKEVAKEHSNMQQQNNVGANQKQVDKVSLKQAEQLLQSGKHELSLPFFLKALEQDPKNYLIHNRIGAIFLHQELFSKALQYFNSALELNPRCGECLNNLGHLKTILGDKLEAEKYFHKAILIDEKFPDPYFNLGVLKEQIGDIESAVHFYQKFVDVYPDKEIALIQKVAKRIEELSEL